MAISAVGRLRASAGGATRTETREKEYFRNASQKHNLVPVVRTVLADQLTPVLAYRCLVAEHEGGESSFLLESVVGGERTSRCG